jgi:hypothetical protein
MPAATAPARSVARRRASKPSPARPDQLVSKGKGKTRPLKARSDKQLQAEYSAYGRPWAVRLPPAIVADLKDIAQRESVDLQVLTRYVLGQFVKDYRAGRVDLGKAKKPAKYDL